MVLIPLKSQYTSLIVTIISGAAELALLSAVLGYNKYLECRALRKGGKVNVRHHRFRRRALTVVATLTFVLLEVSSSFFSDPATRFKVERKNCTSLDALNVRDGLLNISMDATVIGVNCVRMNTTVFWQYAGNLSDGEDYQCGEQMLYATNVSLPSEELVPVDSVSACVDDNCVFVFTDGDEVSFTIHFLPDALPVLPGSNTTALVWKTMVYYNFTGLEREFAKRAADMLRNGISDDFTIRRGVFAGTAEMQCDFKIPSDATTVRTAFIYAIAVAWALSVAAFLGSLAVRRLIFYDMSDPLHWAQKTLRDDDLSDIDNPVVTTVNEHGTRMLLVTRSSAPSDEESNIGTLFRRRTARSQDVAVNKQTS